MKRYSDGTASEKQENTAHAGKSEILANMRHDIRSPLHVVKGLTNVLAASAPLTLQQKEIVSTLKSNVDQLCTLIDNMFDFLQASASETDKGPAFASMSSRESPIQENDKHALHAGEKEAPGRKQRVLLVEDYAPTILMTGKFLEYLGYEFEVARTGHEALEKYSHDPFYDFVLMDLQLPDIDGFEITRRIRAMEKEKEWPCIPVIATSGLDEDRMLCLRAGMNDCLSKPFGLEELEDKFLKSRLSKNDEPDRKYSAEARESRESEGGRL